MGGNLPSSLKRPHWEEQYQQILAELTESFMGLRTLASDVAGNGKSIKSVDSLYKKVLNRFKEMQTVITNLQSEQSKTKKIVERQSTEIKQLTTLYTAGITFASETESHALLETAIDIVIQALEADAGYIVMVDDGGEIADRIGRHLDDEEESVASDLSLTVIHNTLQIKEPTRIDDTDADQRLAEQASILRLDIKSTLCVPLVLKKKVVGAVYLDRRNKAWPFTSPDLAFLMAFGRQIVHGLQVTRQVAELEDRLVSDARLTMAELREKFKCNELIGNSMPLFEALRLASRIAPTNLPVLITGESGTGKELIARAIHLNSAACEDAFVAINCSAIPANLLESELFGYEKGAFTGAQRSKPGKIEMADGGTLFLDEIGELDISLQAKLLRVLQTQEFERLGSVQTRHVQVRVLAATNTDLLRLAKQGKFREDLYYRLKVVELPMPPLRNRREDIPELINFFLSRHAQQGKPLEISAEAQELLENYDWPGNIRELENVIQRGIVLAKGESLQVSDLPPELVEGEVPVPRIPPGHLLSDAETEFRRRYIERTLKIAKSNAEAARLLGVNRTHFYRMLAQLGIEK